MANEKRLIDANQLRETLLAHLKSTHDMDEFVFDNCFPYWIVSKAIKTAPTVDAVEVVHGRWKEPYMLWVECSECGTGRVKYEIYNYCPNCGADMRGDPA